MVQFQVPLPGLARDFQGLTFEEKSFIEYFSLIDPNCVAPVVNAYAGTGPKGYGASLVLSRMIKVKEQVLTDRQLARALRKNDLYRFITGDVKPSHNTFHTLRKRLGVEGFAEIHKRFVLKAHSLNLLEPEISALPQNRKKGIILIGDSTFLITSGSTKGCKDEHGRWQFTDKSVAFSGKGHHRHKYAIGHKAHSLRTINGIPIVTIVTPASESDQNVIVPLLEETQKRYPMLSFAYIILDRGYDAEDLHHDIYESFNIIPIIIRKKMVYPVGFSTDGYPLCEWRYPMRTTGIDYEQKRTRYACFQVCRESVQYPLFVCEYAKEQYKRGCTCYTYFQHSYRKYGPAVPHSLIYKKLKSFRTGIERTFALVKENRFRMEMSNYYKGIENVTIHAIEHDIVLTQDIIYDYLKTGKRSPVLNLNY